MTALHVECPVIGGGPIGFQLGQAFNTLGCLVTILEAAPRILGPVVEELAIRLQKMMRADGIDIQTHCRVSSIIHSALDVFVEYTPQNGDKQHRITDTVLLVTGRRPNVERLGLENTIVKHSTYGTDVDTTPQTKDAGIYAVGDVFGQPLFSCWASAQGLALARYPLGQAVAFQRAETNTAVIFSKPEIGIAGLTEQQAQQAGLGITLARYDFHNNARAQIDSRKSPQPRDEKRDWAETT